MKETKQGTMALVQVHVDLFTTTQRPNESVEAYYKIFCARRDTVNAHGGEAGYHRKLYEKYVRSLIPQNRRQLLELRLVWMRPLRLAQRPEEWMTQLILQTVPVTWIKEWILKATMKATIHQI